MRTESLICGGCRNTAEKNIPDVADKHGEQIFGQAGNKSHSASSSSCCWRGEEGEEEVRRGEDEVKTGEEEMKMGEEEVMLTTQRAEDVLQAAGDGCSFRLGHKLPVGL